MSFVTDRPRPAPDPSRLLIFGETMSSTRQLMQSMWHMRTSARPAMRKSVTFYAILTNPAQPSARLPHDTKEASSIQMKPEEARCDWI